MATVTASGFIYAEPDRAGGVRFVFFDTKGMEAHGYVLVAPHEITLDVPDDSDLLARYTANLERLQKDMRMDLERVESKLAALGRTRDADA